MTAIDVEQVVIEQDVPVGRGGDRDLLCDIYRPPAATNKHTAIIHIHGGGFTGGSKAGARTAPQLAALGYTCVSTQYRLASEAKWPAQIQDIKASIRWVRSQAAGLEIEPDRVVVLGYSAGGHLALIAAGSHDQPYYEGEGGNAGLDSSVAACVAFYPPQRYDRPDQGEHALIGDDNSNAAYDAISPITYVRPGFPPTVLLHGTADSTIPVEASLELYNAMREADVKVELHVIEGVTHIFDRHVEFAEAAARWIDLFLDRHVVNPRQIASTEPGR